MKCLDLMVYLASWVMKRKMSWPLQLGVEVGEGGGGVRQWCFPPLWAFGKLDPLTLRVFARSTNLGSRASYRHGGRDPLPTKRRETPIKTLTGEASGT
jgi:hypothetical protein